MARVSKNKLPRQEYEKLFLMMTKLVAAADQKGIGLLLTDLLGEEEQVMLVKRFAAVMLFAEGNSSYLVWQTLNISPSTAERIHLDYERGRYKNLVTLIKKNRSQVKDFWGVLEVIIRAGLPPRNKGRWKSALERLQ